MNEHEKRIAAICGTNDEQEIQTIFAMMDCDQDDCSPQEFDEAVTEAFEQWKRNAAKYAHPPVRKGRICCVLCDAQVRGATFHDFRLNDTRAPIDWVMCPNHVIACAMRILRKADVQWLRKTAGCYTFMTHGDFYDEGGTSLQPICNSRKAPRISNYVLVVRFFNENDNQWITMRKLVEATGIPKNSVRDIVYRTNKASFERRDLPGRDGPAKQFRLRS